MCFSLVAKMALSKWYNVEHLLIRLSFFVSLDIVTRNERKRWQWVASFVSMFYCVINELFSSHYSPALTTLQSFSILNVFLSMSSTTHFVKWSYRRAVKLAWWSIYTNIHWYNMAYEYLYIMISCSEGVRIFFANNNGEWRSSRSLSSTKQQHIILLSNSENEQDDKMDIVGMYSALSIFNVPFPFLRF